MNSSLLIMYSTQNDWLDAIWIVQAAPNAVPNANPPIGNHGIHISECHWLGLAQTAGMLRTAACLAAWL